MNIVVYLKRSVKQFAFATVLISLLLSYLILIPSLKLDEVTFHHRSRKTLLRGEGHKSKTKHKNSISSSFGRDNNKLKILLWVTPRTTLSQFHVRDWAMKSCPVQCELTKNSHHVDQVDALIYLGLDFRLSGQEHQKLPIQRKPNQIRVFYNRESPLWYSQHYEKIKLPTNEFNWTMTYRLDSDIYFPYGRFELNDNFGVNVSTILKFDDDDDNNPKNQSLTLSPVQEASLRKKFLPPTKTKLISWTVSHCRSHGKREELVKRLNTLLPGQIDVYGACGKFKCPTSRFQRNYTLQSCYEYLAPTYKFYLSLENSLCYDYVTEKLYYALAKGMVPIVYGGADYSRFAPRGSYIDARSFRTIKELADYITFLDKNPKEYLKYFLWTEKYHMAFDQDIVCTVCQRLHKVSVVVDDNNGGKKRVIDPNYTHVNSNVSHWYWYKPEEENKSFHGSEDGKKIEGGKKHRLRSKKKGDHSLACHSPPPFR